MGGTGAVRRPVSGGPAPQTAATQGPAATKPGQGSLAVLTDPALKRPGAGFGSPGTLNPDATNLSSTGPNSTGPDGTSLNSTGLSGAGSFRRTSGFSTPGPDTDSTGSGLTGLRSTSPDTAGFRVAGLDAGSPGTTAGDFGQRQASRDATATGMNPAAAPVWPDTGDSFSAPPGRGGTAVTGRPDRLSDPFGDLDDTDREAGLWGSPQDAGPRSTGPRSTGRDTGSWNPDPDRADDPPGRALPPAAPARAYLAGPETSRESGVARAAGRTRAAAANARKASRRKSQTQLRLVGAGLGAFLLIVIGIVIVTTHSSGSGSHPGAASQPTASATTNSGSPSPSSSLGAWQHITARTDDPAPLTLPQLFPARFTADNTSYVRTVEAGSGSCRGAVFGSRLQAAVRRNGCDQVMRASYLDARQKMMGTIGVLNLADFTGASRAGHVTGSSDFIAQLDAHSGPTRNLTKGTGLEEAEVKGHYLILTWVEYTTLGSPSSNAQKLALKTFSENLISDTANVSLTSRMVTGNPQVP